RACDQGKRRHGQFGLLSQGGDTGSNPVGAAIRRTVRTAPAERRLVAALSGVRVEGLGNVGLYAPGIGTIQLAGTDVGDRPEGDRVLVAGAAVADDPLTLLIVLGVILVGVPSGNDEIGGR